MKKLYTTSLVLMMAAGAGAQAPLNMNGNNFQGKPLHSKPTKVVPQAGDRSIQSFYIDYQVADEVDQSTINGFDSDSFIWRMNYRYNAAQGDTSLRYAIVDFSEINDSYGLISGSNVPEDYTSAAVINPLTIDSAYIAFGHENNSGTADTIEFKFVALNGAGYPQTGTVLYTHTEISQAVDGFSFTGGADWLNGAIMGVEINHTLTAGQRFGLMIEYKGSKLDTFGIIAGFAFTGATCTALPQLGFVVETSLYDVNSYRHDIRFAVPPYNYALLPSSGGGDTYYDCDGVSGYDPNNDSDHFLQNWGMWVKVTGDLNIGIDEVQNLIATMEQNVPNPFSQYSRINYTLRKAADATFTITDLSGKVVMSEDMGTLSAGKHIYEVDGSNLSSGVYYCTLNADGTQQTIKMMISK